MKSSGKIEHLYSGVVGIVLIVFYGFFAFYDGAVICVDTPSYIDMSISREFLYPSLLAVFRSIIGEGYLLWVVVFQSLLTAYVTWNVTMYLKKQFSLNYILTSCILCIFVAVSLLNRFVAGRGSMYSNSILTEGIAIPLFLLFFRYLYEYLVTGKNRALCIASVLTGIMIATRKQMYVALALLFLVMMYVQIKKCMENGTLNAKNRLLALGRTCLLCVGIILAVSLMDHTYNYVLRGKFVGHASDSRFVLTMVMYTSEEEYAQRLPEELQPLFTDIYLACDSKGYLMHSAGEGWYNNVVHFGDYYDRIQIDTMWPAIRDYAESYSSSYTETELMTDEITHVMLKSILPVTAPRIAKVLLNNFWSGMVTTIAQRNHILIWYSIVAYLLYIGLIIYYHKRIGGSDPVVKLCLLTLLSIVINVGLVSAVIFCQTRYTIYNMPLFYISGMILLWNLYKKRNDIKKIGAFTSEERIKGHY